MTSIIIIFCIAAVIVAALYGAMMLITVALDAAEASELEELKDCENYWEKDTGSVMYNENH